MCITLHTISSPVHISHCRPLLKPCVAAATRFPACQRRIIRWILKSAICQAIPPASVPQQNASNLVSTIDPSNWVSEGGSRSNTRPEVEAISDARWFTSANRKVAAVQEKNVESLRFCGFCRTHRSLRYFKAIASRDGSVVNYAPYCAGCTFRNAKLRDLVYRRGMDLARAEAEIERMIDNQPDRQCSRCEEELPASFFPISPSGKQCRACVNEQVRNRQRIDHPAVKVKECSRCGKTLPGSSFHVNPKAASGLKSRCKDCNVLRARDDVDRIRSVPLSKSTLPSSKICYECGQEKLLSDFHNYTRSSFGIKNRCKVCLNAYIYQRRHDRSDNKT